MTNAFQSRTSTSPSRRSRPPGEGELLSVFQLVADAALLVDMGRDAILQATPAFLQLTAFAANEVLGRSARDFFPDLPAQTLQGDELFHTLLERRGRPPQAVSVQPKWLDPSGNWRVLICRSQEDFQRYAYQQMDNLKQVLSKINHLPIPQDARALQQTLAGVMKMVCEMFDASFAGVYQMDPQSMALKLLACSGEDHLLPDTIIPADQVRLAHPMVWKPGKRVQTELHRKARVDGLSLIISSPLDLPGLLVIGARSKEPMLYQEEMLVVLAERLSSLLRAFNLFFEMKSSLFEADKELRVWQQAVESSKDGILLLSPDLTVRQMNPAAEWMLGYAAREVQGQPVDNVLIGPEALIPALQEALDGVPTHSMGVVSVHRRNGQSFPAEFQVIPVQYRPDGNDEILLAIMVSFRDVSAGEEIRQRTHQLEQRAVLGEVTAVFAHEVRNPINNISTGLQLLSVKLPENDPNQENITRLINDCQRLNHLMESVLNFSRQVEHKFEEVDLEALLKRLLDRWRPRMNKVNVTFFFHYEEGTPHVLGDPRSLEQVFTNLISNAVEAMSQRGGSLAVRVDSIHQLPGHPQVEVTVTDSGPGIPDEILDRIFEPFITTKAQGTGLGLAITKRIVTAHHGSIRATSFPGGSVFQVILLAYQGEAA